MTERERRRWLALALLLPQAWCGGTEAQRQVSQQGSTMTRELAADLEVVGRARILFSHHSVGANILEGIALVQGAPGQRRVEVAPTGRAPPTGPALLDVSGGRNGDPRSKIDFFAATLRERRAQPLDLAFLKLCYVDFDPRTDVTDLLAYYRSTIDQLKLEFPRVRFAHVTVPLMTRPTDLKSSVRRLLGMEVWGDGANVRRNEFNRQLLEAFRGDPVFDLAKLESGAPDGTSTTFGLGGQSYLSLYPGYTDDGGHLNQLGKQVAGTAAIHFMAGALRPGPAAPGQAPGRE